jgi:hypothetical protein
MVIEFAQTLVVVRVHLFAMLIDVDSVPARNTLRSSPRESSLWRTREDNNSKSCIGSTPVHLMTLSRTIHTRDHEWGLQKGS